MSSDEEDEHSQSQSQQFVVQTQNSQELDEEAHGRGENTQDELNNLLKDANTLAIDWVMEWACAHRLDHIIESA
jgi:hypothetical protein